MAEFIQYIREDVKIKTSAIAARNSVAAAYAATQSLRNGGMPAKIPPLSEEIEAYFNSNVQ